jgi:hypothetical protein
LPERPLSCLPTFTLLGPLLRMDESIIRTGFSM